MQFGCALSEMQGGKHSWNSVSTAFGIASTFSQMMRDAVYVMGDPLLFIDTPASNNHCPISFRGRAVADIRDHSALISIGKWGAVFSDSATRARAAAGQQA
jgi:hypothetical protein